MRTQAALCAAPGGDFDLQEVEVDPPRRGEVLVEVVAAGLCHTDLLMGRSLPAATFPRILGHEGAGVVRQVGDGVDGIAEGDHVVLSFRACRTCDQCRTLGVAYCRSASALNYAGARRDGSTTHRRGASPVHGSFFGQSSFARHTISHADNTVVVDPTLDLTLLGPYGCGFQTGAGAVLNVLRPAVDDSLVVHGAGAVGLAALAAAAGAGVRTLVAVDVSPSRLEVARSYGAATVDPGDLAGTSVVERVRELTDGGAARALDTTGVPSVIRDAVASLRTRGELAVVGLGEREVTLDVVDVMTRGKVLRGSIEGDSDPHEMVPRLLELSRQGAFDVDRLVTRYPIEKIGAAVADTRSGSTVKPVLVW